MTLEVQKTNPFDVLRQAWVLPAIVRGMDVRLWEEKPTDNNYLHLTEIWEREGFLFAVDETRYRLTALGQDIVRCEHLFRYTLSILQDQGEADKPVKSMEKYQVLRLGLAEYTHFFMRGLPDSFVLNGKPRILDYCGGAGEYLRLFLDKYRDAQGFLVDKVVAQVTDKRITKERINFKTNPDWPSRLYKMTDPGFDLIMLIEILHCVTPAEREYLLTSAMEMLRVGGKILVGEQHPTPEFEWRMRAFTDGGTCVGPSEVEALARKLGLRHAKVYVNNTHYFYLLQED